MDRVTEEIAHFIGLLEVKLEEARQRETYREFQTEKSENPPEADLLHASSALSAAYQLQGFEPHLSYQAPGPAVFHNRALPLVDHDPVPIPPGRGGPFDLDTFPASILAGGAANVILPEIDTIGSVAIHISQHAQLSDNDYFGVGGHGLIFDAAPAGEGVVLDLAEKAAALSPIDDLEREGSAENLPDWITTATERLAEYSAEEGEGVDVFVHKAQTIEGIFVNGQAVDETPKLEDHLNSEKEAEQSDEPEEPHEKGYMAEPSSHHSVQEGPHASVSIETGGNQVINDAVLKSFWTAAPVTAVVGAHFELNAVIQINAWCDVDAATGAIAGWSNGDPSTTAFNIASFERYDTTAEADSEPAGGFPQHWVVKEIAGDLMIVNWLEQLTFMMDNDVGIVSSSGVTIRIQAGDNVAYNDVSLEEIGFGYDLVIIGGNVYDASIIHQLNILCDSDLIGAVGGFQTAGNGSVSMSDNLLWNEAYIYNVGGADRFEALPAHYQSAAESLAAGGNDISQPILSEAAFAGTGVLKVLYIHGDLVNLQYVKQTNVLGDSDQVALAMHAIDPSAGADWTITTGSNALINNAAILDLDSTGKTYVGNGHYSDEVLVQAEIISTEPELGWQDPDQLVNEAVAFLHDEMQDQSNDAQAPYGPLDNEGPQSDGLQTMLG